MCILLEYWAAFPVSYTKVSEVRLMICSLNIKPISKSNADHPSRGPMGPKIVKAGILFQKDFSLILLKFRSSVFPCK